MNQYVFVQSEAFESIEVLDLDPHVTPATLFDRCLSLVGHDTAYGLYLEDRDDVEGLDALAEIAAGMRLHLHRRRHLSVTVCYAGHQIQRDFRPGTTIRRVKRWAARLLSISVSDAAELMLQVEGSDQRPDEDIHIGTLTQDCGLKFDLVPSPRINGAQPDEAVLRRHLSEGRFIAGCQRRWTYHTLEWPHLFVSITARDGRRVGLKIDCSGYPNQPPTAVPWDQARRQPLSQNAWPKGGRVSLVFNPRWQSGTALYLPCDRTAIAGHGNWLHEHPSLIWDPKRGITQYLEAVHEVLQSHELIDEAA
ncbi:MAG: hypothetical protein ACMZ66_00235 [Thalassospira sp.]|uniref:DUF7665 family protein n=1 Tax=Thalassospira sp. TaxID=1912094 RepID=UPI003A84A63E